MAELIELLTNWAHWAFEIISGGVFFAVGLVVPERYNPFKRLVSRHDREKHEGLSDGHVLVETSRMVPADGDPGWWGYAEKDAWHYWSKNHPVEAKAIKGLCSTAHFTPETCSDFVLTSGVQFEGLCLRIAELLGLHPPVQRAMVDCEMADCDPGLVDNPESTPIDSGVELHWICCDLRLTVQRSIPFRLTVEQIPYLHKQGVLYYEELASRTAEHGS